MVDGHKRIGYAQSSLHIHTHTSRRSSFLSSSLPDLGFASVLTLHESFSKEALGSSPAFSPAAVEAMSTLFSTSKLNILLGKDWVCDATALFFTFHMNSDVTRVEMTSSVCAQSTATTAADRQRQITCSFLSDSKIALFMWKAAFGSGVPL